MSWTQIFGLILFIIFGFLFLIYKQQEKFLYLNGELPSRRTSANEIPYRSPEDQGLKYEEVWLTTPDKIRLHAWFIFAPIDSKINKINAKSNKNNNNIQNENQEDTVSANKIETMKLPTIIWYHANAGNMGHRLPNILKMIHALNANVFIFSYRGYGESEGVPSEKGLKIDGKVAFEYILNRDDVDKKKIFLFGRSLGGAVATHIASLYDDKIAGLILENTFKSISDMVGKVLPLLDYFIIKKIILKMQWRTMELIPKLKTPILFLASEQDEVVPHSHMLHLHDCASLSLYKLLHVIPRSNHNDAWIACDGGIKYWKTMNKFVDDCIQLKLNNSKI